MNFRSLWLVLVLLATTWAAQAHTIWLEAAPQARIGVPQTLKVYFGEYREGKPSPAARWFSDLNTYKLMMTAPDGSITELDKQQDSSCYTARFTPAQEGVYTFWLSHEVKDVFKEMKITYTAAAYVSVHKSRSRVVLGAGMYQLVLPNARRQNEIQVLKNGLPYSGATVLLEQMGNPDGVPVQTNAEGRLILPSHLKGNYLLELPHPEPVTEGMHHGQPYKVHYLNFTYLMQL